MLREAGEFASFSGRAIAALPGTLRYGSEIAKQAAILVRGSTLFVFALAFFLGGAASNFGYFFLRTIGATDALGVVTGFLDPRLTTTIIFGYAFTSKVCCGFVAEIGAKKVQEEVEALESTGIDPRHYIVGTRTLAVLIYAPIAAFVSLIGNNIGSWFVAVVVLKGISSQGFLSIHWEVQTVADQLFAVLTVATIAISTTLVACFYGFRATSGPASVGAAAARSLLVNLVLVHVIAGAFAVFFYGTNIQLPLGG